jgi:putative transposase
MFRQDGTWEHIHDVIRKRVRVKHGKQRQPSAAILDSQSVKTTEKRGYVAATTPARR